jgi:hypothetical protein
VLDTVLALPPPPKTFPHDQDPKLTPTVHRSSGGSVPGTREWIVTGLPYIIVHEIDPNNDELILIGIFHGAQDR